MRGKNNLPVTVIDMVQNLLVTDKGIRGLVIQLADNFAKAWVEGTRITATAGLSIQLSQQIGC